MLSPADVRRLATAIGLRPTKAMGQNFLHDPNTIRRIVKAAAVCATDVVVEVGPGLGSLTLGLLATGAAVTAVELDPVLAGTLADTVTQRLPTMADRLTVLAADALRVTELPGDPPNILVANLPYNVAVPVLLNFLERFPSICRGLVMVQSEVAERLVAGPGSKTYGVPSVKAAWWASVRPAGGIPRSVFWPVPNVDSSLVAFDRRDPPTGDRVATFAAIDAAFAQRRKTLRAALAGWAGSAALAEDCLRTAGVDPSARGEAITVADFARVAASRSATPRG